MPKIIQSMSSRRYFVASSKRFSGTQKTATRFPTHDHAEETLEDLNLLGRGGYEILNAPETARLKAAAARKQALADKKQAKEAALAAKKAAKSGKKGGKKRDAQNPGIVQNADGSSWMPWWTRRDGTNKSSGRRFRTTEEAQDHANRWIGKRRSAHSGLRLNEPVNSWVNWRTRLTNPKLGDSASAKVAKPAVAAAR